MKTKIGYDDSSSLSYVFGLIRYSLFHFRNFILILICLLFLAVLNTETIFAAKFRSIASETTGSFYEELSTPIKYVWSHISNVAKFFDYLARNTELVSENQQLREKLIRMETLVGEAESLKKIVNLVDYNNFKTITVRMAANTSSYYNKSFTINAGELDGVKIGQSVVNNGGMLGKVISVHERSSQVIAVNDSNANIPAVFTLSRSQAVITGQDMSDSLEVLFSPRPIEFEDGDSVVTSGEDELMPANILIGHAYHNGSRIEIRPAANLKEVDFAKVYIGK
ncbi:MAG: rod shape-determining protein MreC [Rickettsiales bacterium]